jgi:hypothetical protein
MLISQEGQKKGAALHSINWSIAHSSRSASIQQYVAQGVLWALALEIQAAQEVA